MRRACLLLLVSAIVCIAQQQGFVNKRLLRADFLGRRPAGAGSVKVEPGEPPCLRIPREERMPARDVDRKMVIPVPKESVDPKMVIAPPPVCPEK